MMGKIRILQFPIANSYGGITHYALNNWYLMDKTRFCCDFATMSRQLDFSEEVEKTGSRIFYLSCYPTEDERQFRKEFNTILDNGYDVVHLHTKQWKNIIVEEICKEKAIKKVIVHAHSTRCDNNDLEKRKQETLAHEEVKRQLSENVATDYWACSSEAAEWLYGDRIPRDRIQIMPNAIDTYRYAFHQDWGDEIKIELGLSKEQFLIGNVGRMVYQKNQKFLIDVFAEVVKENADIHLAIIGDGEFRTELEKQAESLGISDKVFFLGFREDINKIYSALDMFVLTSKFEGLPISVIEAQAAGVPVLCMDNISKEANITGNVTYVSYDIESWKHAILDMMGDNRESSILNRRDAQQQVINAGFDLHRQIKNIEEAYARI